MVCLGNICRSPMAEGIMQHLIQENGLAWTVDSAGTESYHVGEPPHLFAQKVCKAHGIDISGQRARQFTANDFERFDKIYALAADVQAEIGQVPHRLEDGRKVCLFLNELHPGANESVPDPWYGPEAGYLPVYDLIAKTCRAIVAKQANPL